MKKIIVYFLVFVMGYGPTFSAFAAYGRLTPPPGWSPGGSAAANTFRFASASTATTLLLGRINANAALTVAGSSYAIPVGMKLGADAAIKAANWSFGNPLIFAGLLAIPVVYDYFTRDAGIAVRDGVIGRTDPDSCTVGPCVEYEAAAGGRSTGFLNTKVKTCNALAGILNAIDPGPANDPYNYTGTPHPSSNMCNLGIRGGAPGSSGSIGMSTRTVPPTAGAFVPITLPQFQDFVKLKPIPDALPKAMPEVEWPVEAPVVNPNPTDKTKPTPIWLPTGEPVKNPTVTGQPDSWTQPGVKISPSPTISDPWRVDITPDPITKGDPSPNVSSPGAPAPGTSSPTPDKIEIEVCGLPGKPKCQIDELDTKRDRGTTFDQSKTDFDTQKDSATSEIGKAEQIQKPIWTFAFNLPTGCAPFPTGLRGVIIDMCKYQATIHNLLSMIWAGTTVFTLIGMVGRTIRES